MLDRIINCPKSSYIPAYIVQERFITDIQTRLDATDKENTQEIEILKTLIERMKKFKKNQKLLFMEKLFKEIGKIKNDESSFNPFDVIVGRLENIHSNIIVKILEQSKYSFLDSFAREVLKYPVSKKAKITREASCKNGRIDILIEDDKTVIIIENKVDAKDQEKQLIGYYENKKQTNPNKEIAVFYLTLDGKSPEKHSIGDLTEVKFLSYQNHILDWLEKWYKENKNNSDVDSDLKTIVKLYIEQIRKITRKNKYTMEILETVFGESENKGSAILAIELFNAMNSGTNLLQIEGIRTKIKKLIREIVSSDYADGNVTDWYGEDCEQFDDEEYNVSFYISGADIYVRDENENPLGEDIVCNNLNNKNLQSLLTENKEGIKQWLEPIYDSI